MLGIKAKKTVHRISFADLIDHQNGIVEAIVDEAVEVNAAQMHELHRFMLSRTPPAHGLFANRKNSYAFAFSALACVRQLHTIHFVAEVTHGKARNRVIKALWPSHLKLQFFDSEAEAMQWLQKMLHQA